MNRNFDYKKEEHTSNITKLELNLEELVSRGISKIVIFKNKKSINIVDSNGCTIFTIIGKDLEVYDWWGWGD